MIIIFLFALIIFGLFGCGGGGGGGGSASAPVTEKTPTADKPEWTQQNEISGICCNYSPTVVRGHTLLVYSNSDRSTPEGPGEDGAYWLRQGTVDAVGAPLRILQTTGEDAYIRTSAVTVDALGRFYALLYSGRCYGEGCQYNGYSPSWAESPDGIHWTWKGHVSPFERWQHSAGALIVNEAGHRFQAWLDNVGDGVAKGNKVTMMHSADGLKWTPEAAEVLPAALLGDDVEWLTAARTPYGVHLFYANHFPTEQVRHLWSCDGLKFRALEVDAPVRNPTGKGVQAAYDAGVLHLFAMGLHWTTPARGWSC